MTEQNVTQGTPVDRVNAAWDRIEAKLPADALGAPATESELDELEKALGLTPDDILARFFTFDEITINANGASLPFVPERLKG
ncbi:hypothetical protein, partial [Schaalia sp.]|uniref:hypothetical protein n=1 Tax=Schaalia sp. TaxID=2691890 RepID=UPI003D0A817A